MRLEHTFNNTFDVNALHDQLLTLVPDNKAAIRVESKEQMVWITYPDNLDKQVKTLLAGYTYAPRQVRPDKITILQERITELEARIDALGG